MRWVIGILLLFIVTPIVFVLGVGFYLSPQDELQPADAIVAISGGETDQRTAEAVELFNEKYAPIIIFSGAARDEGVSNASVMKSIAIKQGVPEEKILVEEKAQDTFDNAKYVQEIVEQYNIRSIILVTSPYHQRRAAATFREFLGDDVTIINHSSTDSAWRKNGWWKDNWAKALTWSELRKVMVLPFLFGLNKS